MSRTHPFFKARVFAWLAWVSVFLFASSLLQGNVANHTLFIKKDGSLWGMGNNDYGQLADSNHSNKLSPQQIDAGPVIACASGGHHTLFVKSDFTLWTVGRNSHGQLGDNTGVDRNQSVQVATDVVAVAAGGYHSLFTKKDGSLWGMGDNGWKQLGFVGANLQSPAQLLDGNVSKIACGWSTTMFLKKDGTVWGAGVNSSGQLGTGTSDMPTAFVQATSIGTEGADIAISNGHSLVVKKDGSLWGSGKSQYGQLFTLPATGNLTHSSLVGSGVRSTSAGAEHSTYLKSDNTLWGVGRGGWGALGTNNDSNATVLIAAGVVQAKAGSHNTIYLDENGTLWGTGQNNEGELGVGTTTSKYTSPIQITTDVLRLEGTFNNALAVDLNSTVNLEMIWVEPGTFAMGSPTSEPVRQSDETEHNVTLTKGFYLGKYEVTQAQYEAVMTGNAEGLSATPSEFTGNDRPVEKVSWTDAQIFLTRLNAAEQAAGRLPAGWSYVLPTESEWEYACRAGTTTVYSWGNAITSANANYSSSVIIQTCDVGQYTANPWGFFDMHGNVYEWTADWYGIYPTGNPVIDPTGVASSSNRVKRGGSWLFDGTDLRSAKRHSDNPNYRNYSLGFRLAFKQVNTSPNNLNSISPLTIAENQPIGTVVGEFNATDPDAEASLTYHLVSGAGDGNNSLFDLNASTGALTSEVVFDYENNATVYSIRVQVKDEYNATLEGSFTVSLTDRAESVNGRNLAGFTNVADLLGLSSAAGYASVAWGDYDGNGYLDLYLSQNGKPNKLYSNPGVGLFSDLAPILGVDQNESGDCSWVDFDADGDLDLCQIASDGFWLWRNDAGVFTEVSISLGLSSVPSMRGYGWFDYDGDEDFDLFITSKTASNKLFKQQADGTFSEVGSSAGVSAGSSAMEVAVCDYDNDGWPDLIISGRYSAKRLMRNNGDGTFTNQASSAGVGSSKDSHGVDWADFDGDGDFDLHVSNWNGANEHFRNNGNGNFTEIASSVGVDSSANISDASHADYDGDGDPDLFLSNIGVDYLFRNDEGNFTTEVRGTTGVGIHWSTEAYGVPNWIDFDGDGDLEFYMPESSNHMYQNLLNPSSDTYLKVRLIRSNGGLGAPASTVRLYYDSNGSLIQTQHTKQARVRSPQGAYNLLFQGLNPGVGYRVEVTFPGGAKGYSGPVSPNGQTLTIRPNTVPSNLNSTAPLTIAENQPVGKVVGEFNATDPDAGASLTYHLVSGAGDGNNSLFTLETNGTLKTATTFDYESNASTYSIRVQAKDELNATVEGNFAVTLTDVIEVSNLVVVSKSPTGQTPGLAPNLTITFSEPVQWGSGYIKLVRASDDVVQEAFEAGVSSRLGLNGDTVTIDPSIPLVSGTTYHLRFDSGAVRDLVGDYWTGFASPATWSFTCNATPVITSNASASVSENQISVSAVTATDAENNGITYGIAGGADQAKFLVNSATGEITFASAPDFESPTDAGTNNTYEVTVSATDGYSTATQAVTVTVTNQNEAPVITQGDTLAFTLAEDGVLTNSGVSASDVDSGDVLTWSATYLTEGNGTATVSGTGNSPPTFNYAPYLNFHGSDVFVIRVTDAVGLFDEITVTATVTPMEDFPSFTFGGGGSTVSAEAPENQRSVAVISVTEADNDTLGFAITGGADASHFAIEASTGDLSFIMAPDFEAPADANGDNVYEVIVTVTDDGPSLPTASQMILVTVTNVIDLSTFIFTASGASGSHGPTQAQVDAAYAGTDLAGFVAVNTRGIQEWIVPFSGDFNIQAMGGKGGANGGAGASISGDFSFVKGDRISILVGQQGRTKSSVGGGGGGSFVVKGDWATGLLLIAAGGGGGGDHGKSSSQHHGRSGTDGGQATDNNRFSNLPGSYGYAATGSPNAGNGGAGFLNGFSASTTLGGNSVSFRNGGTGAIGNSDFANGGFGGGGTGDKSQGGIFGGGGGGGYSGGAGGARTGNSAGAGGGGGGSFNAGINQVNQSGLNIGHGKVVISALNTPPSDVNLLPFTIPENLSANTVVGNLSTVDPDDVNSTGIYQYALVDGSGSTDNASFSIDANGTLRALATFDYEALLTDANRSSLPHDQVTSSLTAGAYRANLYLSTQANYPLLSIRVRTTDEYNAFHEKVISVAVLDRNDEIPALPAPSDVALDGGFLKENQPAGTWAGYFRAPHAVAPEPSKVYSHTLVDGNGSADNASFSLDLNGTLRSSAVFDFETKNAYQIRVRSTDPFGGFREQAFVINVVDCFIPVVETLSPINLISTSAQLHGRLVDDGALTVLERGFVLGSQPDPSLGQADVLSIPGISSIIPGGFQSESGVLSSRLKYYYRAYVINSEGIGYGLEESFLTQGDVKKPSWIESTPGAAKDWWSSAWFGNFFQSSNGWVMHEKLGWIYPVKSKSAGMWFWMTGQGWLWTDAGLYPRAYADNYSSWVYFYGALEGKKLFYVYREERWITATSAEN